MSLNQTVAMRVWLLADFYFVQLILNIIPPEKIIQFEMLKMILVDNICYRFLVPLLFLLSTKRNFPELWTERPVGKIDFYQTEMRIIPRRQENTDLETCPSGSKGKYVYVQSV